MAEWYVSKTDWTALTPWAAGAAISVGIYRRVSKPGSLYGTDKATYTGMVFKCTNAGTGTSGAEPQIWPYQIGGTITLSNGDVWENVTGKGSEGAWVAPAGTLNNILYGGHSLTVPTINAGGSGYAVGDVIRIALSATTHAESSSTTGHGMHYRVTNVNPSSTPANAVTGLETMSTGLYASLNGTHSTTATTAATGAGTGLTVSGSLVSYHSPGDTIYVAHDHSETQTLSTLTWSGSATSDPIRVLCVNKAAGTPGAISALRTTATITNNTGTATIALQGSLSFYGFTFTTATGGSNGTFNFAQSTTTVSRQLFEQCKFIFNSSPAANRWNVGSASTSATRQHEVVWKDCRLGYGSVSGGRLNVGLVDFTWIGGDVTAGAVTATINPTSFMQYAVTGLFKPAFYLEDVDLSAIVSPAVLAVNASGNGHIRGRFHRCNIGSTTVTAALANVSEEIVLTGCRARYDTESYTAYGELFTDTGIYRNSGASDGGVGFSWRIIPKTIAGRWAPFNSAPPMVVWAEAGSRTITVEGAASTVPNKDDIWIEVSYLDAATGVTQTTSSTRGDGACTTSTETWTGAGALQRFKLSTAITVGQAGYVSVQIVAAKASTTFYVDPKVTVT